jgi:malonyl-CoA/methylmalonyl-CoA synthetase
MRIILPGRLNALHNVSVADPLLAPLHRLDARPAVSVAGRGLSYRELREAVAAVARRLRGAERVAVWAEPALETCAAMAGALAAGVPLVPLNPRLGDAELRHVLADSAPDVVLGPADVDLRPRGGALPDAVPDPESAALIVYTSGTTGPPKGAVLSHRAIAANLDALALAWAWTADDVVAHALPLFHVHGLVLGLLGPLRRGGELRHGGRFDPAALAVAGGSIVFAVPTMYHRLGRAAEADGAVADGLRRARLLVSGSAPLPAPEFERIERLTGQRIAERYGLTETLINTAARADGDRRPGSVGPALPGVQLRLAPEPGGDGLGEVAVRGPNLFSGYLGRPDATAAAMRDGWFLTGDLATQDPDGGWRIVGRRATDLIKTGGYKVGAGEVEAALLEHPAVREAAVTAAPDDDLGERIVAWVVPEDAAPPAGALADHVAGRLAPHKRPREVRYLAALPRNAMGKVVKARLGGGA